MLSLFEVKPLRILDSYHHQGCGSELTTTSVVEERWTYGKVGEENDGRSELGICWELIDVGSKSSPYDCVKQLQEYESTSSTVLTETEYPIPQSGHIGR
jgi:hypothetical protein